MTIRLVIGRHRLIQRLQTLTGLGSLQFVPNRVGPRGDHQQNQSAYGQDQERLNERDGPAMRPGRVGPPSGSVSAPDQVFRRPVNRAR